MRIPQSIQGRFKVRALAGQDSRDVVLQRAQEVLRRRSFRVETIGRSIVSKRDFWGAASALSGSWHPLASCDDIRLDISGTATEAVVAYDLSVRHLFGFALFAAIALPSFLGFWLSYRADPITGLVVALVGGCAAFAWFYGFNFAIVAGRAPIWLERKIGDGSR